MLSNAKEEARCAYKKFKKHSHSQKNDRRTTRGRGLGGKKKGTKYACKMSQPNYDKLRQASSLLQDHPTKRNEIRKVYKKLMDYQNEIDKLKREGDGLEGDKKEINRLELKGVSFKSP